MSPQEHYCLTSLGTSYTKCGNVSELRNRSLEARARGLVPAWEKNHRFDSLEAMVGGTTRSGALSRALSS